MRVVLHVIMELCSLPLGLVLFRRKDGEPLYEACCCFDHLDGLFCHIELESNLRSKESIEKGTGNSIRKPILPFQSEKIYHHKKRRGEVEMIKKWGQLTILFVVLPFLISGIASPDSLLAESEKTVSIKIATATKGGTFYPVGVALAELWSMKLKNHWLNPVKFTAVTSAGSKENITLLKENKADMAILQGLSGSLAWDKTGLYRKKAYRDFRAISNLWPNVEHFVLAKSKVKTGTIADIKGTRFSIGQPDSGTEESTLIIMNAFGMDRHSIIPSQLGYEEAVAAIKKGELDGASLVGGNPCQSGSGTLP